MSDFGTIIDQIASEINRTDIDSLIGTAIQVAIRKHQENKVSFSQAIDTTQVTTIASEDLALPDNNFSIGSIRMTYATNDEAVLDVSEWTDLQKNYPNDGTTGRPREYAIFGGVAKLRYIPNASYSTVISYYKKFTLPISDGDTHIWMTNAPDLIKWEAKSYIYADVLEDEQRATYFSGKAIDELARIKGVFSIETQSNRLSYN